MESTGETFFFCFCYSKLAESSTAHVATHALTKHSNLIDFSQWYVSVSIEVDFWPQVFDLVLIFQHGYTFINRVLVTSDRSASPHFSLDFLNRSIKGTQGVNCNEQIPPVWRSLSPCIGVTSHPVFGTLSVVRVILMAAYANILMMVSGYSEAPLCHSFIVYGVGWVNLAIMYISSSPFTVDVGFSDEVVVSASYRRVSSYANYANSVHAQSWFTWWCDQWQRLVFHVQVRSGW